MRKRWLILFNALYLVSILLIVIIGPFYSNYSTEHLVGYEPNSFFQSYSLNFTSSYEHELVAPTFLDWESIVYVSFNSTQPTYVLVTEYSILPIFEESTFGNGSGNSLVFHIAQPSNYTVLAKGFGGIANATVTILLSIVSRSKPYATLGQVMYYGGIGLLIVSIAVIVLSYLRKEKPHSHALRISPILPIHLKERFDSQWHRSAESSNNVQVAVRPISRCKRLSISSTRLESILICSCKKMHFISSPVLLLDRIS